MTQEDKDLLLKDLCARLPYGVKIVIQDTFKYSIVSREYHVLDVSNFSDIFCFNYKKFDKRMKKAMRERPNDIVIKPYLFPLSSMTDEQRKELEELYLGYYVTCQDIDDDGYIWDENVFEIFPCTETDDWCNKNHFDYRGLIPKGIALDATGKNVY